MHVSSWLWLYEYWNWLSDKTCISFYQFRCYLLQFTKLCINTSNHNQFDTWVVTRIDFIHMPRKCKNGPLVWGASLESKDRWFHSRWRYIFVFKFIACTPLLTARQSPCKWNQAWPFSCSACCFRPHIQGLCIYRSIALRKLKLCPKRFWKYSSAASVNFTRKLAFFNRSLFLEFNNW